MKRGRRKALAALLTVAISVSTVNLDVFAMENSNAGVGSDELSVSAGDAAVENLTQNGWDGVTTQDVYESDGYRVIFTLTGHWSGGYNANIRIENTGDTVIENWYLGFDKENGIANIWNAEIASDEDDGYTIKNAGWNQDIAAGGAVEFGFSGNEDFRGFPGQYELLGCIDAVADEDYSITYHVDSDWGSGFTGTITITNNTSETLEDWVLEFDFDREITGIWEGVIEEHSGRHYVIRNAGYNANITGNSKVSFGFTGRQGSQSDIPENYVLGSFQIYNGDSMELDTDGDGLVDGIETQIGLNYKKADTDGDGLSDYQELYLTMTDPLLVDTDGNGISDADEDPDRDGLTNKDEISYGTNPLCADTDGDNLTDFAEILLYQSNPLVTDTDGDGLDDYDDVSLGFSPLLQDTDGNGISDADEKVNQTVENNFPLDDGRGLVKVDVSMNINGNINKNVGIINVYETDRLSASVVGLIGVPVEIRSNVPFDTATIQFTYDEAALGDTAEEDLAVLWYDEANGWYQILDQESIVDTQNNTVSYVTTHFSTYMLVDKNAWYDAWRENIDYRISSDGDEATKSFDIAFVVDVSGSMQGQRITNAKKALSHFVGAMQDGDEAAIIPFHSYASILSGFTDDKLLLQSKIDTLSAFGGTNVNNGLLKALEAFEGRETDKQRIIVLICDGDVNYYQSTIDRCIEKKIQIYAVNVLNSSTHVTLQTMTSQTNGQYYYGSSVDDLTAVLGMIQDTTVSRIDPTDNDGDGLYDIYEQAGMKLPNGRIIYTDPTLKDTDGDGLTDFEETGIIYNVDDRYIGLGEINAVKYFMMRSDPTSRDTDQDGIGDKEDPNPCFADYVSKNLSNKYTDLDYLNADGMTGGKQGWWMEKADLTSKEGWAGYEDYMTSPDYRMGKMGCGVIAMSDAEIYLTQQNDGYAAPFNSIVYDAATGAIARDDYMRYAEYNRDYVYYLKDDTLNYVAGVLPVSMEAGMELYLISNHHPYTNVTWAPYCGGKSDTKLETANKIETMISRDLPVVFSYSTMSAKNELKLYRDLASAEAKNRNNRPVNSHYMTVIGYTKYLKEDGISYSYILKVVSWGDIYYVDYDEYADKLSYVTNILEIGE